MPYPPESPWNLPPTDGQVRAITKAGKILHLDITEKDIPESRWRARDLQMDLWERVRSKGKQEKANCTVLKEHDDGDLTMECNERKYVITTEGEIFGEEIICECGNDWIYAKVGTTEMRGKKIPSAIEFEQVSPSYDKSDIDKAVKIIEEKLKQ